MPNLLPALIIAFIWGVSFTLAALPVLFTLRGPIYLSLIGLLLAPLIFGFSFILIAGLISRTAQRGIKKGKFPREALHPVYLLRRIYGACWTQVYYFKPLYAVVLAIPVLKKFAFRLFGYKGETEFTVYPDTWLRDLPLLEIGKAAYLSNRSTIGTNICLKDGTIYVSKIKVKEGAIVGHLAMLAPGVIIHEQAEVGVGCAIGLHVHMGPRSAVKPSCTLNHGAILREDADVGTMSYVGLRAEIGKGVILPAGSTIPSGAIIKTQEDAEKYFSSETQLLAQHKKSILHIANEFLNDETIQP